MVTPPGTEGRRRIFEIHSKNIPLDDDVDIGEMAAMADGYVGADIEAVCREAAMLALREDFNIEKVSRRHFIDALDKVKPTINDDMIDFYNRLSHKLKGGTRKAIESGSYTGYI
jgi:transitional endoplasmic reticulum ATPase